MAIARDCWKEDGVRADREYFLICGHGERE